MAEETEKKILDAAQHVFMQRGFEGARMQQIADEAEVNKSMLHYYYSSKKKLFKKVYREAVARMLPQLLELLNAEIPLERKIPRLVERYITMLREHPRLPGFVLQEINQNPNELIGFIENLGVGKPEKFMKQISIEQEKGVVRKIPPRQLLVNIVSLCVFPFAARPMVQFILNLKDDEFEDFLDERVQTLSPFILNAIAT